MVQVAILDGNLSLERNWRVSKDEGEEQVKDEN